MVQKIVDDIRVALNNNLYFVALSTALTLPDICGKAEYPDEKSSKKRYMGTGMTKKLVITKRILIKQLMKKCLIYLEVLYTA